jgi:hypothetical protein
MGVVRTRAGGKLLIPIGLGLAVAVGIYVFGTAHTPDYSGTGLFGRTALGTLSPKSWLATAVLVLAVFQLGTAMWLFRWIPGVRRPPRRLATWHRVSGAAAILVTLPVAYHCMFAYGVQTFNARVAAHSLAGAFLYGAIVAKLAVVRWKSLPTWLLPLAGGTVVGLVALLWYTSALWYFQGMKLP